MRIAYEDMTKIYESHEKTAGLAPTIPAEKTPSGDKRIIILFY